MATAAWRGPLIGALLLAGIGCREAPTPSTTPTEDATLPAPAAEDAAPEWRFALDEDDESYELFVSVHPEGADRPELDWRPRSRSLRIALDPDGAWSSQVETVGAMLAELSARRAPKWDETQLFAHVDLFSYPELGARLAKHAHSDPEWARVRHTVRKPGGTRRLHDYIRSTLRARDLHPELDDMLAPIGRRPRLVSLEKCWSDRPSGKSEASARLRDLGFTGRAPLPGGCLMMWFELVTTSSTSATP